jgi:hypothetical protein
MNKHQNCTERCQLVEDKGYRPCEGPCFYAEQVFRTAISLDPEWPLTGFNAVMNAISDEKDYCDCGAVHSGLEDMGRCEACGKVI